MPTITVFGATGPVGQNAVNRAIEKGFKTRAFTRDATKHAGKLPKQVEVFEGSTLIQDHVDKAIDGTDYVVIAIGTSNDKWCRTTDLSEATKNIITAMKKYNVKTVSGCISGFLYPELPAPPEYVDITEEHTRMHVALKDSGLNYVAVFPGWFTKDSPKGDLLIELNGTNLPAKYTSEKSLGEFLVDSLQEPKYYNNIVGIANPP